MYAREHFDLKPWQFAVIAKHLGPCVDPGDGKPVWIRICLDDAWPEIATLSSEPIPHDTLRVVIYFRWDDPGSYSSGVEARMDYGRLLVEVETPDPKLRVGRAMELYWQALRAQLIAETSRMHATEPAQPPRGKPTAGAGPWDCIPDATARMIVRMWCEGFTAAEIANHPDIARSPGTVRNIITDLRKKHGEDVVPYHRK